ncbi:hypothetical protein LPJ71_003845, partial [Coemansia sp. S17]
MVSQTEILSGQALQALLGPEFKGAMFQAATRLKVKLELSEDNLQQDVASADNIRKFVACIKGMLPYVQSIDIVCKGNYCYQEALACQRFERWLGMYFSPETTLRVYRSKMILPSNL